MERELKRAIRNYEARLSRKDSGLRRAFNEMILNGQGRTGDSMISGGMLRRPRFEQSDRPWKRQNAAGFQQVSGRPRNKRRLEAQVDIGRNKRQHYRGSKRPNSSAEIESAAKRRQTADDEVFRLREALHMCQQEHAAHVQKAVDEKRVLQRQSMILADNLRKAMAENERLRWHVSQYA